MARIAKIYTLPDPARRATDIKPTPPNASRWNRLKLAWAALLHNDPVWHGLEGLLTYVMAATGLMVWLPFDTFKVSRIYQVLGEVAPEAAWGAAFCLPASYHLYRWLLADKHRLQSLSVVIGQWTFLTALSLIPLVPSVIWFIYPVYVAILVWRYRLLVRSLHGGA